MRNVVELANRYRRTYSNWIGVMRQLRTGKTSIALELRNHQHFQTDRLSAHLLTLYRELFRDEPAFWQAISAGVISFEYKGRPLRFRFINDGHVNGDILNVFFKEEYAFLDPQGALVLDIGASIADSSIYFLANGATHVVALEPFPYSYRIAAENLSANGVKEQVSLMNAGYGKAGSVTLTRGIANQGARIERVTDGLPIRLYPLSELVELCGRKLPLLLKMDCEGSEYGLMYEGPETLREFTRIQLEYHRGRESLVAVIRQAGFDVTFREVSEGFGQIYARRIPLSGGVLHAA